MLRSNLIPAEVKPLKVLLVEDNLSLANLYVNFLQAEPVALSHVATGSEAMTAIRNERPSVVFLDLQLPDMNGIEILNWIQNDGIDAAVIVVTADGSLSTAVEAMKAGALDFLVKPFNRERLVVTLRNALERQRLSAIVEKVKGGYPRDNYCGFVGSSVSMQAVYQVIESAAQSKATVFVTGESGTGKEVCAHALHDLSPRNDKPFVPINCAAIPRELMESAIFGHVKGAFTGATQHQSGAAKRADGGTLFLDEVCEMDADLQTKLLRFIQTGSFEAVGSPTTEVVDVRFICATNRDPWVEVQAGRFREDLYYRLHVIPIQLPPLRERDDDILTLVRHFIRVYAEEEGKAFRDVSPEAARVLLDYSWPGNIRELQNVIRNAVVLYDAEVIEPAMLPAKIAQAAGNRVPKAAGAAGAPAALPATANLAPIDEASLSERIVPLWKLEKEATEQAIELCGGNIARAAAYLGISPSTIYRKRVSWEAMESNLVATAESSR
ncbi:sigma-54-dependent transcriptional regulator [Denitrobaculum tricleocarpae]|uniref:Sigma-54-dependent Fis family transcriptional regulator n=1 Tax=Denitrobaculum tricleocarpae TaxID=2591009 RepID=A0A545TPC6_9PROT|nr:sigma-54 dependent transcriptional regulator [Denitrobaculum tricleocarpae]TQV79021.1 sigma-54-dependent Fis family transcriptional regulator [Denitrobaculum tricleocarpae]